MYEEIEFALSKIHAHGWDNLTQAILEFGIVALQIPQALHTCEGMGDDLKAIEEWASIFTNPAELSATIAKHYALHRKAIQADIASDKAQWEAGQYWAAGITTADLATLAIGPIKPVYPAANELSASFDALAVPDYVAGLIYGFTGDNELPEIEACFTGTQDVVTAANVLLHDLENGQWVKAIDDNAIFAQKLSDSVHGCSGESLHEDFVAIAAWSEIFTEPVRLSETVTKNWFLHKRAIKKDIQATSDDWNAGAYFQSGVDTADAFVKLVGPVV